MADHSGCVQVLHRGHCGGADDFQTVSVELPTETLKKRRPEFGNKTFLALESRLEDDMNIPLKVCVRFLLCVTVFSRLQRIASLDCASRPLHLQGGGLLRTC